MTGERQVPPSDRDRGSISSDRPIRTQAQDSFSRSGLARLIAAEIRAAPLDDGLAIAVTGAWGIGKTSVINLAEEELGDDGIVLRFNPWLFSGAHELVTRFFGELAAQLRQKAGLRRVASSFAAYGRSVAPLAGLVFGPAGNVVGGAADAIDAATKHSAYDQLEKIRKRLEKEGQRIVVIIDDIDRLDDDEVAEVMRLVKLVGDLPGLVYLLAYDRERVEAALDKRTSNGHAYLEKIVQIDHRVPPISRSRLREFALERLGAAVGDDPPYFDTHAWSVLFTYGIEPYLSTPRDAYRYANNAPSALSLVEGDVASHDVLALEALRIFEPAIHERLAGLAPLLTGERGLDIRDEHEIDAENAATINAALEDARHPAAVRALFRYLFPSAAHHFGGSREVGTRQWRAKRRVADLGALEIYLHATIPPDQLATGTVLRVVRALQTPSELRQLLETVADEALPDLLDRLRDYRSEFPHSTAGDSALAFLELRPRLATERGMFEMPPEWSVNFVAEDLLNAVPDPAARAAEVEQMYARASTLSLRWRVLNLFGTFREGDARRAERALLPEGQTLKLEQDLRRRVAMAVPSDLADEDRLLSVLKTLVSDGEEPDRSGQAAAAEKVDDPAAFAALLRSAFQWGLQSNGGTSERFPQLSWGALQRLVGEDRLSDLVERHVPDEPPTDADDELRAAFDLARRYAAGETPPEY